MRKILFLEYNNYPIPDAVGNCANKLRRDMHSRDIQTDVLTFRWDRSLSNEYKDDCGTVYLEDTWMYYAQVKRDKAGKIIGSPLQILRACVVKALAFLCGGLYVRQDKLPAAACRALGKKMQSLCKSQQYDWVIAFASPFCILWTAVDYLPKNCKCLLYYLDPLYYEAFPSRPSRIRQRLKKETYAWDRADGIVIANEYLPMAQNPAFNPMRNKLHADLLPSFEIPRRGADCAAQVSIAFDRADINCVYLGTLYEQEREPRDLLKLFLHMQQLEPRIKLYLIGDKFGKSIAPQLHEYEQLLGDRLVCLPAIPLTEGEAVLQRADILVSIGNKGLTCFPSKVFDLLSLGKPLIHLCQRPDCNALPFIKRYPLQFHCFSDTCEDAQTAREAVDFCVNSLGAACGTEQLLDSFRGCTTHDIAGRILDKIQVL